MSRAEYYRAEATRCQMVAVSCRDPDEARRWRDVAKGHQEVAERFEALHRLVHGTLGSPQRAV